MKRAVSLLLLIAIVCSFSSCGFVGRKWWVGKWTLDQAYTQKMNA